jgi:thiol:disulfide interchange protein DsbA
MKRREFTLAAGATVVASSMLGTQVHAQIKKPVAGVDYRVVETRAPVDAPPGKIEVVEFFWYNCPHCFSLEPLLAAWAKKLPKDVVFRRVPRRFADNEVPQQLLYYTLEAMGLVDKLHSKIFEAVHIEHKNLTRGDAIAEWIATQGVDKTKFMEQYNSFTVTSKATRAAQLQNAYKIEGVPVLGVAGRFWSDVPVAGSPERLLQVVDSLIADIRSGK